MVNVTRRSQQDEPGSYHRAGVRIYGVKTHHRISHSEIRYIEDGGGLASHDGRMQLCQYAP
jgi:hypothetical protein